jgi:hypothetical protein
MSHFTVLVIGNNPEEQLMPFDENMEVEEYRVGLVSDEEKGRITKFYTTPNTDRHHYKLTKEEVEENKKLSFEELYEKYGEAWNNKRYRKDENGDWTEYSTYNPESKWDWYVLGGRWTGYFLPRKGKSGKLGQQGTFGNNPKEGWVDQIKKGDIDFVEMKKAEEKRAKKTYKEFEEKLKNDPQTKKFHPYFEFGVKNKSGNNHEFIPETKEEYIERCNDLKTYAVVKDGVWYQKGDVGWFGMSSNEKDEADWSAEFWKLIRELPDDTMLSLYDCHI